MSNRRGLIGRPTVPSRTHSGFRCIQFIPRRSFFVVVATCTWEERKTDAVQEKAVSRSHRRWPLPSPPHRRRRRSTYLLRRPRPPPPSKPRMPPQTPPELPPSSLLFRRAPCAAVGRGKLSTIKAVGKRRRSGGGWTIEEGTDDSRRKRVEQLAI